jgi:hypothetical protein
MKMALRVAGVVFAIMSILHVLRLVYGVRIVAGTFVVPMGWSLVGATAALVLTVWMFKSAASK